MRRFTILEEMAHTIALAAAALFAALIALAGAATAVAAAPEREWLTLNDTFAWDFCGFPVEERVTGRLHFISWYDEAGARTRQLVAAPGVHVTWTNTATGASVTSANPFVVHKRDNPDGSTTIAFTGLGFAIRGGGQAFVDSGRDVIVFSESGVELLSSSGPNADLCEALEAAIG